MKKGVSTCYSNHSWEAPHFLSLRRRAFGSTWVRYWGGSSLLLNKRCNWLVSPNKVWMYLRWHFSTHVANVVQLGIESFCALPLGWVNWSNAFAPEQLRFGWKVLVAPRDCVPLQMFVRSNEPEIDQMDAWTVSCNFPFSFMTTTVLFRPCKVDSFGLCLALFSIIWRKVSLCATGNNQHVTDYIGKFRVCSKRAIIPTTKPTVQFWGKHSNTITTMHVQ